MAIDKIKWHLEDAGFRTELPPESAGTHIGLFKTWAVLQGFASAEFSEERGELVEKLLSRSITPGQFGAATGEALLEEELSDAGAAFTAFYYRAHFYEDVLRHLCRGLPSMYHVADSWESYETLERVLATRVDDWRREPEPRSSPHGLADGMLAASSRLTQPATLARQEVEAELAPHRSNPWVLIASIPLIGLGALVVTETISLEASVLVVAAGLFAYGVVSVVRGL